jgi:hypothetical protein
LEQISVQSFLRDGQREELFSDMVVDVFEAAHTDDKVIPSPSDVYSDFIDRKNGVI